VRIFGTMRSRYGCHRSTQLVGEALGLHSAAGTKQRKDAITAPVSGHPTFPRRSIFLHTAWDNGGVTKTSVGCRLISGGSALIDRLWAPDSGSCLRVPDHLCDRDHISGHPEQLEGDTGCCYDNRASKQDVYIKVAVGRPPRELAWCS
jgi:hypothetical protein